MQFSDTTNKNGCIQFIESLCKLGDGGITGESTLFKQITSYFNQGCKKTEIALLRVDKNWRWDDSNYTDFPIATITLVDQQRDYTLPASVSGGNASTLWKINRVRILGLNGIYYDIYPLPADKDESPAGSQYSGAPMHYRLIGNSIRLSPIPKNGNITLAAGLEVQFQRSGVDFTTASTSAQPGFIDAYHDLPCYDAASAYLMPINSQLALVYAQIFRERLSLLGDDWTNRNDDAPKKLYPRYRSSR